MNIHKLNPERGADDSYPVNLRLPGHAPQFAANQWPGGHLRETGDRAHKTEGELLFLEFSGWDV